MVVSELFKNITSKHTPLHYTPHSIFTHHHTHTQHTHPTTPHTHATHPPYHTTPPHTAIMKQRQQAMGSAGVLDHTRLKELREKRLKEIQIEAILKECLIYIFFILVLYFISYQDKDNRSFTFVQNLQNQYFETSGLKFSKVPPLLIPSWPSSSSPPPQLTLPTFSPPSTFPQISTYDDVYTWINHTLMTQLYTGGWYNGERPTNWKEAMQTNDHVTIRLGVARIRQLRIKEGW